MRAVFLLLLLFVAGQATLLDELICATNITFADTNVPDETPNVNPAYRLTDKTLDVTFALTDTALAEIYWVQIDTATVAVTAYSAEQEQLDDPLSWADLLAGDAILVQPGKFTGCPNRGCDGFTLASVPFLALWNSTAKYFLFSTILHFYGNSSTVSSSATLFSTPVQTAPPSSGSVLVGSVLAATNLTATQSLRDAAFGASSSSSTLSAGAIAGIAVGAAAFVVLLIIIFWNCRESRTRDYTRTDGRRAGSRDSELVGGPYSYGARHRSSTGKGRSVVI
jgi:hypothetical protein